MNEHRDTSIETEEIDELLTAYLDDELTEEERAAVDERLRTDAGFRGRLARLQKAWDLLDTLPRTTASDDFTQSTVELVAHRIADDAKDSEQPTPSRKASSIGLVGLGAILAGSIGFFAIYTTLDAPNRRLLNDLPVLEKLDEYRYAESIEFLEMLDQEGLFSEEASDDAI